jgi:hypothetical protein
MHTQSAGQQWDVNQERVFLENLMQTRFNFFLVVFGLWIIGVANTVNKPAKLVFLFFGIVICTLLWLAIRRICQKVMAALRIIKADPDHAVNQVAREAGEDPFIRFRSNHLIGYVIPLLCILLLVVWFFYVVSQVVKEA